MKKRNEGKKQRRRLRINAEFAEDTEITEKSGKRFQDLAGAAGKQRVLRLSVY